MPGRVIILGGGVAGMSAAHELIERDFEVVVLERAYMAGGKARSIPVITSDDEPSGHEVAAGVVAPVEHRVPGEHGFRFFPGFYKHVIDTMQRIPLPHGGTAADHLVPTTCVAMTQYGKPELLLPAAFPTEPRDASALLRAILLAFGPVTDLTADDLAFFAARIWQILTSCGERRLAEYERTSWWEFIGAGERSPAYQKFLASGITRSLVAAKAREASTRTIGDVFVQLVLTILNPLAGSADRVLDGPTNLVWIDPWRTYLEARGVHYLTDAEVKGIRCVEARITGVDVVHRGKPTLVQGDHYVAALPLERITPMINASMLAADPSLASLRQLVPAVEWMNGVQFYLTRAIPAVHGHAIHIDTEWALTSISQLHFWRDVPREVFGDSDVQTIMSVDVSDWEAPGPDGRPAMEYSRDAAVREVWRQLKQSVNAKGELLRDEDLESWFLDPDIQPDPDRPGVLSNAEPLLVNWVDTWRLRPEASTGIANLFLASDYVRTHTDLATMEGANEAARRAVNALLDAVEFAGARCAVWPLHEPDILAPWRLYDAARFKAGLAWDNSLTEVAAHAIRAAAPLLDAVPPLLEKVRPFVAPVADVLELGQRVLDDAGASRAVEALQKHQPPLPLEPLAMIDATAGAASGAETAGPEGFLDRLDWYRDMLSETLAAGIPQREPQRHLYALVKDFIDRSGKGLRPALCLATARALGGRGDDALPAAAGIEMLHNAFLVHDDIEDGSESRRGAPAMHRRAGMPIALNTGDAMNALAMRFFRQAGERLGPMAAARIFDEVDHMLIETLEGQATELGWVRDNDLKVGADDYMRLVLKKTAWYSFIHPMRIGALVADPNDANLDRFDAFGFLLGLAFQVTDDVLNLTGDMQRYGKEVDGDLFEGKRTLLLTHALGHAGGADREWIGAFLARPREQRLPREVFRLRQIVEKTGSLRWAEESAEAFAKAAELEFDNAAFRDALPGPDLDWLRSCVPFLVRRDR